MSIEPKINKDKYKVKYSYEVVGQDETKQNIEVCVRILKVDEEKVCVEFTKVSGPNYLFHENFTELTKNVLNFSNDSVVATKKLDTAVAPESNDAVIAEDSD